MSSRQRGGIETFERLLNWQRGDAQSQRLAFSLIAQEGYLIDPMHSLGGPDGGKDAFAFKDGLKYVVAVYFPNGKKTFAEILKKFRHDSKGIENNHASGIVFFVNQYLTESERKRIQSEVEGNKIEIYHNELISNQLNKPVNYGRRLEFLDIEMEKEEQLSFYAAIIEEQANRLEIIRTDVKNSIAEMKNIASSVADHSTGGLSWLLVTIHSRPQTNKYFEAYITTFGDHIIPAASINIRYNNQLIGYIFLENVMPNVTQKFSVLCNDISNIFPESKAMNIEVIAPCFNTRYSIPFKNATDTQTDINNIFTSFNYRMHHSRTIRDVIFSASYSNSAQRSDVSIIKDQIHKNVLIATLQKIERPEE